MPKGGLGFSLGSMSVSIGLISEAPKGEPMLELIGVSFATSLGYALTALFLLFFGHRLLDRIAGRPWDETIEIIRGNALATAIYFAARWVGSCLLIGLVMSR